LGSNDRTWGKKYDGSMRERDMKEDIVHV
jgi:hypothetical protein